MKLLFYACVLFGLQYGFAQNNTVVSGGTASGSGGSASYTVGQIDYSAVSSADGSISQGVQHAFEISTLGIDDFPTISLDMMVFPNPTTSKVTLKIGNYTSEALRYEVYDIYGRKLQFNKILEVESEILFNQLPSATYLLMVFDQRQLLKTFKIIKTN
ncbi:T9SS type A sorting domain-containing protein [Winogradskyella sp. PC D3.3]